MVQYSGVIFINRVRVSVSAGLGLALGLGLKFCEFVQPAMGEGITSICMKLHF